MDQHIVGAFLVDCPGTRFHRRFDREDGHVFFIGNLDFSERLRGRQFVFRNDCGDVVSVKTYSCVEEFPVGDVLMFLLRRPRVSCGGELDVGYIEAGDYVDHSRNFPGFTEVEGLHQTVGNGAVQDLRHQGVGSQQVLGIFRLAGDLLLGIDSF